MVLSFPSSFRIFQRCVRSAHFKSELFRILKSNQSSCSLSPTQQRNIFRFCVFFDFFFLRPNSRGQREFIFSELFHIRNFQKFNKKNTKTKKTKVFVSHRCYQQKKTSFRIFFHFFVFDHLHFGYCKVMSDLRISNRNCSEF